MEAKIAAEAPLALDYVKFQISPENRYDACFCSNGKEEVIGLGSLDQLVEHLPNIKDQVAKRSCDSFILELPDNAFTKATLTRFLNMVASPDPLNKSISISKEMSQLEDTRKFHFSLYAKAEDGIILSDNSKNELLRAMDSRITALTEELVSTFNITAGGTFSCQEMMDLQSFCQYFGDEDTRHMLSKLLEMTQKGHIAVPQDNKRSLVPSMSKNDQVNKTSVNNQISGSLNTIKPVAYRASPAKAAEVERQSPTESEDSSFSSEDERSSDERSRTLIRSATPRRSASSMRRIQIGRSGPRRTPALTIKSLTCFPAREGISSYRDMENDGELEESEEPNKKTQVNVTRISVQDAISLFESKQKNLASDAQNKAFVDSSPNGNKAVLRRWSSGMGESQKSVGLSISENAQSENKSNIVDLDTSKCEDEIPEDCEIPESPEIVKADMESEAREIINSHLKEDFPVSQEEKINEKMDSSEWSRQNEAELNQMPMKFAEYQNTKPDNGIAEYQNTKPDNGKERNTISSQKGVFGEPQKSKRDEKRKGESVEMRAQSDFRVKQKVQNKPKAELSSMKISDQRKKKTTSISPNANKNPHVSSRFKTESPKPSVAVPKKTLSKSTPVPATRKSWPLSPRATGASPAMRASRQKPELPAFHRKPQSQASLSRPSKSERSQLQQKDVKRAQVETKRSTKRLNDNKNQMIPTSPKTKKIKPVMAPEDVTGTIPVKAALGKKVAKKSTVVPLEGKQPTRKISGASHTSNPIVEMAEIATQVEESITKSEDLSNIQGNAGATISDTDHVEGNPVSETDNGHIDTEREMEAGKHKDVSEEETSNDTHTQDEISERMLESPAEIQPVQELISPVAWVESDHQDSSIPNGISTSPSPPNNDMVAPSEPQVRHSLSQMLLQESSGPDIIEWGNAENPPTLIYQKDAPKGLKRLLKFARKSKGEANGTAWAYTSEGEDDGDECKSLGKRNSDNLRRKIALHSKNYGEVFLSDSEPHSAQSNMSNSSTRSSNKFQEGHPTLKGTRSFFSLSAFRGNKT